jgi:hypothetical protein
MPDMIEEIDARLKILDTKLRAREGKPAYRDNVPLLKAEIERLRGTKAMILEARENGSD